MISLLMIADDFTGALDTGVQFAASGVKTRVVVGADVKLAARAGDVQVLVVDAETRHLAPELAYAAVEGLTRQAVALGVEYIYKKTDSALRGNIGAELAALLEASGRRQLAFLPAYPRVGRTVEGGVLLVDGVPVAESVFGRDPFEPVEHSGLAEIIGAQRDVPVHLSPALKGDAPAPEEDGILVFDGASDRELAETGRRLLKAGKLHIMAGCAGFGAVLPQLLGLAADHPPAPPALDRRLLVVCGSVNPITVAQLDTAQRAGVARWQMTPEQKLQADYWQTPRGREELTALQGNVARHDPFIIDTNDPQGSSATQDYAREHGIDLDGIRLGISRTVGYLVSRLFPDPHVGTILITGGDTLLQCMGYMGVDQVDPVCELSPGVVLSRVTYHGITRCVLTKSGGFGQETLVADLARLLAGQREA